MDHSEAIMDDARKVVDAAAHSAPAPAQSDNKNDRNGDQTSDANARKRKSHGYEDARLKHGSRRGGRNDGRRNQKGDMGRGEYYRENPDKRQKTQDDRDKRQRTGGNSKNYGKEFSKEEIDAEERRPKRKVAVMIGYSGTGYRGMQITPEQRTIEGDLFRAFIDAGAISKANADDPKKAGLVRCARTDKGVHAAGNMISLKLIVEDEDIVQKINSHLSPQIRIWGIERTIGSFSCYQACDSRWYEYLMPSYAFLPPHPSSWLGKKLVELAGDAEDLAAYEKRQANVKDYWVTVDSTIIKPILDELDDDIRGDVIKALQGEEEAFTQAAKAQADIEQPVKLGDSMTANADLKQEPVEEKTEDAAIIIRNEPSANVPVAKAKAAAEDAKDTQPSSTQLSPEELDRQARLKAATKRLRIAYSTAKRRYRIPKSRIDRIQQALSIYVGTKNYHNYTVQKTHKDPSAKRHIKSFVVNPTPHLIGDASLPSSEKSEWLSMKVHGQSFMMHQIRKMVGMATLLVRCGSDLKTMDTSFSAERFSIPKVPGLGLLLERPVFDSYNTNQAAKFERAPLVFSKYETEIEEFKQREIYERIFREEEESNAFNKFFNHVDNFKEPYFLFVTGKGVEATKEGRKGKGGVGVGNGASAWAEDSEDEKYVEDN